MNSKKYLFNKPIDTVSLSMLTHNIKSKNVYCTGRKEKITNRHKTLKLLLEQLKTIL